MKIIRGLYSILTGIILLPIVVLWAIVIMVYLLVTDIKWYIIYKENIGKESSISTIKGIFEAALIGIRSTILWVKYGKHYFEHIEEL